MSERTEHDRPQEGPVSPWAPPPAAAPWDEPAPPERDLYADLSESVGPAPPPGPGSLAGDPGAAGVPDRPVRRRRTALLLAVGAVALVAGGTGGAAGAYLVERDSGGALTD